MDPVLTDKILSILAESYPAIGSKDIADKLEVEENTVIQCMHEVRKIEYGLFSISSGIGNNLKEYQPLIAAVKVRIEEGGFSMLRTEALAFQEKGREFRFANVLNPELQTHRSKSRIGVYIFVLLLIAAVIFILIRYLIFKN